MSEEKYEINDYKSAFDCFVQRFLVEKKSIFRLNSKDEIDCNDEKNKNDECCILTKESVQYLMDNFVNNGYSGDASFEEKIKHQLIDSTNIEDTTHRKNAIEILATAIWLWRLPPANAKDRKKSVEDFLKALDTCDITIEENNPFFSEFKGFASTGTYYNINKPFELAYIIKFFEKYINEVNQTELADIIISKEFNGEMALITKTDYSYMNKKSKSNPQISEKASNDKEDKPNLVSIHNALLHLFKPDKYEAILSNSHKEKIAETFKDLIDETNNDKFYPEIDWKLYVIKNKIDENFKGIGFYYQPYIRKLWDSDSVQASKNVIYYGVPGTGKTHDVLKEVKELTKQQIEETDDSDKYYKVVQFHPSFSYEDFIDGVKPIGNKDGNLQLGLVNGIFKKMCIEAYKELESNKENPENAKKYYFIADEINRAELSRVFGELLLCLEDDKRLKFVDGVLKGTLIKTQNASLWEEGKHEVVKINDELYFGVPENIYFIGTMNDIDRSIESFDLALRRRFVWIKKETNYDVIEKVLNESINNKNVTKQYVISCKSLNEKIAELIGNNYQLGHSYFLKIVPLGNSIPDVSKKILFQNELKSILTEYLKSIFDEKDIAKNLEDLSNKFIPKRKDINDRNS